MTYKNVVTIIPKKKFSIIRVFLTTLLLLILLSFVFIQLSTGDRTPSPTQLKLKQSPQELYPRDQQDGYTCGYHALAAIYESYGVNPIKANLKQRLGADKPSISFLQHLKGTLPTDMFRVLEQDGFILNVVYPIAPNDKKQLVQHLQNSHYALTLIKREVDDLLHWVVITDYKKGHIVVADSLLIGKHANRLETYAKEQILSTILLKPSTQRSISITIYSELKGFWQMIRAFMELILKQTKQKILVGALKHHKKLKYKLNQKIRS
ncbi:MAG: hypothetical protein AAF518_07045 [Spirochaetota bacterium]